MDPRLQHPLTFVIAGLSALWEDFFLTNLLLEANKIIHEPPANILWFYGEYQPLYEKLADQLGHMIQFIDYISQSFDEDLDKCKINLIILDDFMNEAANNKISHLFTKGSHHKNLSVISVSRNLFNQGKTITFNSHYLVLFEKSYRCISNFLFGS